MQRLLALGARRTPWTHAAGATHAVLVDPEGNLFCVITTARSEPADETGQ